MYEFRFDPSSGILQVTVAGFFPPEDFPLFADEFRCAVATARRHAPDLRLLVDSTHGSVLNTEVAEKAQALDAELICRPGDRAATVAGSALKKIQARRLFETDTKRTFTSLDDARRWLLDDGDTLAA